ncbi:accessory Sec system S-layer assembly protein [Cytobacillus spongiae]|uniref:accessory Sec system S-layer assembly protein n=1 Tax=Cytobacillus spongiae TaxID=2901381 RepID=UPI001F37254B|nr:accessory Sec system S-layer assembly protein [Cytobacillus spongiae]UII55634.1 accessory Sec system S-layer assembly protein [Cytobacillus spongiae]
MLSIFRRKNQDRMKKTGLESSVSSEDLFQVSEESAEEEIFTDLSLHPSWNIQSEQMYVLRFLNNELPPLKPNQISLSGIEIRPDQAGVEVTAFVRNSLTKSIKFQEVNLLLLDSNKEVIAKHTFDLSELGDLPAKSSRPWSFLFPASALLKSEFEKEGWTIAFELKKKHQLDLHETWEQSIALEEKEKLEKLVQSIQPPKQGEVNFMGIQAKSADSGELHVTVLIRNGHDKNMNIQQLPLQVEDASGEVIAKGGFKLDNFEIKANTSKPWTFIFPSSLVTKEKPDLSKWKVYPIQ